MDKKVYRKLAQRLDEIPNGFPETESGIELKILAKIFSPEEAEIAAEMKLTPESESQISQRTGLESDAIRSLLEEMVKRGLIRSVDRGEHMKFGLIPWIVGIYESQLSRMDEELARLFEEYYQNFAEKALSHEPSIHKVIPVEKSVPVEVQVFPYEQASKMMEKAKSFGVLKCICKVQKSLIGEPCKYPEEVCLVFSYIEDAFKNSQTIRTLTKGEALNVLRETEKVGLVHSSANTREGHFYICNCCPCCCGIMRGVTEFGVENSVAKSDFYASVDQEKCIGCGICLKRCHFKAPSIHNDKAQVDPKHCAGCGLCIITCPSEAMKLNRKPKNQIPPTPLNRREWMMKRAKKRGISLENIL